MLAQFSPKSVLFDLDGTLVDTAPDLGNAMNHALSAFGRDTVTLSQVRHMVGHGALAMLKKGCEATGGLPGDDEMKAMHLAFLDHYGANICVESRPYEGCVELLEILDDKGIAMGVCTNKPVDMAKLLIEALGLTHHFRAILGGDSLPIKKPDGGHVLGTLKAMGCSSEGALFIGDSDTDYKAARAAGLPIILLSHGYTQVPVTEMGADAVADHFHELKI